MELQLFIHKHPLWINEFPGKSLSYQEKLSMEMSGYKYTCNGCGEEIKGSSFFCRICDFYLHNSCAKLPQKLPQPLHKKHPLVLQKTSRHDGGTSKCNHCNSVCLEFFYHCPLCKFVLDIKCASSLKFIIVVEIHDHPLALFQGSIPFTCGFCGKKDVDRPYLCAICGFWIHRNCASLPHMVKCRRHKHPLKLTNSFKANQSRHQLCQLCVKKVDTNHGIYYCSSCDYVAHLGCATDEEGRDLAFLLEYKDLELDEFTEESSYIVKKTKVGEDNIEIPVEIKHFSHEHDLKLIDVHENNKICDGCIRPIFPPFYNCAQCNFFLHKSCVELPCKKQHPLHRHMLTLQSMRPILVFCDACKSFTNGFTYECKACKFKLDVSCCLILDTLTHVGHEHPFILPSVTMEENCSACNHRMKIFRCTKCEFTLDFGCAMLPLTTKYRQHEHLFTLCYTAEDNSGEYYCDICEEERDSKQWFYYCEECSYLAHCKCIFGEFLNREYGDFRNIKFGSTYTSNIHQHPLTLARHQTKDRASCDKCGRFCNELTYECATCDFNFQVQGLPNCENHSLIFNKN